MSWEKQNRREFLEKVALGIAAAGVGPGILESQPPPTGAGEMLYRTLGHTGEKVSLLGLGGAHIGHQASVEESVRIVRTAIDRGVTFLDNAWDYNGGQSEIRMGQALRDGYRHKVFLMTKTDGQVKDAYNRQLEDSLRRLQTDVIDLVQFHEVIRPTDPERIFGPDGAFWAALEARKAGKIRYIGFTGHKDPSIHLKMIQTGLDHKFTFASAQMPLNVMDPHYHSFAENVVPVCVKHGIGVLGMKPFAEGAILRTGLVTPAECLHYAMNLPTSVVINGCESLDRLNQALDAVRTFLPLSEKDVAALLAKTAADGETGQYERFKTSHVFDGTYRNPSWLG